MAKAAWQPTATDKDFPRQKTQLTYKGIKEWIALHGSEEDKAWLVETVEENTHEVTFLKVDEAKVKAAFIDKMGLYQQKETASTAAAPSPADKLRQELKIEKKKGK